ncbi:hypothetical protein GCG54_00011912 [Colletotrichum gloeosporioides]|uniref:Uncharacterized protein n=1 Tax=Colletotrichum gloeosporioides TaxID=474922 RepID=A0A8H4C5H1_COLGL|nr:uncharacterized protein GCG54_00011912 [Colletotrichum gloeosporioides]KAF3797820.1 hypothetical protein GCG54_00011912 [Colletotrichum gloeosporioides]
MDHGGNSAHHTNGCVDSSTHANANTNVGGNADTNSSATSKTNATDDKTYSLCPRVYFRQFQEAWIPTMTPHLRSIEFQLLYQRLTPERYDVYKRYLDTAHGISNAIEKNMHNWCKEQLRQGNRISRRQILANIRSICRTIDERLDVLKEQFDWEIMDLERAEAESLRRRLESRRSRHEGWM